MIYLEQLIVYTQHFIAIFVLVVFCFKYKNKISDSKINLQFT